MNKEGQKLLEMPVFIFGTLYILITAFWAEKILGEANIDGGFEVNGALYIFILSITCVLAGFMTINIYRMLTVKEIADSQLLELREAAQEIALAITLIKMTKNEAASKKPRRSQASP